MKICSFAGCKILIIATLFFLSACQTLKPKEKNLPDNWCSIGVKGINMAGAEFAAGVLPGRQGVNYFFLEEHRVEYYRKSGFNTIRFPILWERLQPSLNEPLDRHYLSGIKDALDIAERQGLWLILDLHNYGFYRKQKLGSNEMPASALGDVWQRLAKQLQNYPTLLGYGLMNEPHGLGVRAWEEMAQRTVNAIRAVDQQHFILVGGEHWSNADRFPVLHPAPFINDPAGRTVYEAHIYFDRDHSGSYRQGYDAKHETIGVQRIEPFLKWLKEHRQAGFVGEFSVPGDDSRWQRVLEQFMARLTTDDACTGWAYWAGGRWPITHSMSLEPLFGQDKPQMRVLKPYL